MVIASPFDIRKQTVSKSTIKCAAYSKENDYLCSCSVVDCELLLVDSCTTNFIDCTFDNSRVIAQQEIAGGWQNCRWKGCTFIGDFSSASYGNRNGDCLLPDGPMIVDCDFRQANLNDLCLVAADLKTIQFPRWPNVAFLEPFGRKAELRSLPLPPEFAKWWFHFSGGIHRLNSSLSFNWDMVQKYLRTWQPAVDIAPEQDEVRAILSKLPDVVM